MTVLEMIYEFEQLLNTVDSDFKIAQKPDTNTIITALNIGQTRYIYDKYLSKGTMQENVEYVQKRSDDLRNLIKRSVTSATVINEGHFTGIGYSVAFPSDYLFYMRSDSKINRTTSVLETNGTPAWTNNIIARGYDHVEKVTTTIYNKPILIEPVVVVESSGIIVIVDSYTTIPQGNNISLTYLRRPLFLGLTNVADKTVTTCELAIHTHEEIVRYSVDIFLKEYKFMLENKNKQESTN